MEFSRLQNTTREIENRGRITIQDALELFFDAYEDIGEESVLEQRPVGDPDEVVMRLCWLERVIARIYRRHADVLGEEAYQARRQKVEKKLFEERSAIEQIGAQTEELQGLMEELAKEEQKHRTAEEQKVSIEALCTKKRELLETLGKLEDEEKGLRQAIGELEPRLTRQKQETQKQQRLFSEKEKEFADAKRESDYCLTEIKQAEEKVRELLQQKQSAMENRRMQEKEITSLEEEIRRQEEKIREGKDELEQARETGKKLELFLEKANEGKAELERAIQAKWKQLEKIRVCIADIGELLGNYEKDPVFAGNWKINDLTTTQTTVGQLSTQLAQENRSLEEQVTAHKRKYQELIQCLENGKLS